MSPVRRGWRRFLDRAGLGAVVAWPVLMALLAVWVHAQR